MPDKPQFAVAGLYCATAIFVGTIALARGYGTLQVAGYIGITAIFAYETVAVLAQRSPQGNAGVGIAALVCAAALACVAAATIGVLAVRGTAPLVIGCSLALAAIALRLSARKHLGVSFTYEITAPRGGFLVTRGIYSRIRHPAYLGTHLGLIAIGLLTGSAIGMVMSLVALPLTMSRIRREETLLEGQFGAVFREYRAHTKALVPLVW